MAKLLKQLHQPSINPDEITLIFPNDKPYPWRREGDVTIDPKDTDHPLWDLYDARVLNPVPPETVKTVKEIGVKQAVTLIERDGKVYKIDGLGRIKARRIANAQLAAEGMPAGNVPYVVSTEKSGESNAALRVILNMHREDDSTIDRAKLALQLAERFAWTPAQIATYFKVSITAAKTWLNVLQNAAPEIIKAVERFDKGASGGIAFTTALNYAKLPVEQQAQQLESDFAVIEGKTQARSDKPKQLSASKAAQVANPKAEPTVEQVAEKRFHKVLDLLEEMEAEDRLRVFARFDTTTGELAPLAALPVDDDEQPSLLLMPEDDAANDLTIAYDDEVTDEPEKPTVKRRKRASK